MSKAAKTLPDIVGDLEKLNDKIFEENGIKSVKVFIDSVLIDIPVSSKWAGYAPQELHVRLGSGRRANALKSIVEGFRASSESNFGNRDANGQDWLRDLLDKVADELERDATK